MPVHFSDQLLVRLPAYGQAISTGGIITSQQHPLLPIGFNDALYDDTQGGMLHNDHITDAVTGQSTAKTDDVVVVGKSRGHTLPPDSMYAKRHKGLAI